MTVSLNEGIPPLPTDVTATLSSDTMLSPKFVALSAGTPGGQTLANNATIEGHPAYGLDQITAAAGPLFDNANKLLNNFNVTVTDLKKDLDDFMPKLGPLADSLKTDADNMQNVITNVDGVAKGADSVLGTADKFISATDKQLQEQLKQLHVTLLNLKVVTTYAKELVENARRKTKSYHLQRQTNHAHTRIGNSQKLEATAGKKAVVVAASLCDASKNGSHSRCYRIPQTGALSSSRRSLAAISVVSGLHLDDVGVGTCTVAVIRSYPIIIGGTRGQPGHVFTSHVADVQVLVSRYVIGERIVRGHIQPVTCRIAYASPVRCEAGGSHIGCL